ncbi:hypothetical protein [Streptomyces sp. BBFR102]
MRSPAVKDGLLGGLQVCGAEEVGGLARLAEGDRRLRAGTPFFAMGE